MISKNIHYVPIQEAQVAEIKGVVNKRVLWNLKLETMERKEVNFPINSNQPS